MSNNHIKSKAIAGAALVALSGFVPQPFMQEADAATVAMNVTGKFISGITLAKVADIQMKTIIATGLTGSVGFDQDAAQAVTSGTFIGTPVVGKIKMTAAAVQDVDITVTGMGTFNPATSGTGTLSKIAVGNGGISNPQIITAAGTTGKVTGVTLTGSANTAAKTIDLGATVTWTGGKPDGAFSLPVVVTIAY